MPQIDAIMLLVDLIGTWARVLDIAHSGTSLGRALHTPEPTQDVQYCSPLGVVSVLLWRYPSMPTPKQTRHGDCGSGKFHIGNLGWILFTSTGQNLIVVKRFVIVTRKHPA